MASHRRGRFPRSYTYGLAAVLVAVVVFVHTMADNDLWGHIRFGQDIISARSLPARDSYSFTSDRPWVNHEWVAEVAMAVAWDLGGSAGLVILKLLVTLTAFLMLNRAIRIRGASDSWRYCLLGIAAAASVLRVITIRPQVFSVCFTAILLLIVAEHLRGKQKALILVVPLFVVWANTHGGWLVGAAVLFGWSVSEVVQWARGRSPAPVLFMAAFIAVCATLLNPYGWRLWAFLAETVRLSRSDISEWGPLTANPVPVIGWAGVSIAGGIALARRGWSRTTPALLVVVLAVVAFKVGRLDAFYAFVTCVACAPAFRPGSESVTGPGLKKMTGGYRLVAAGAVAVVLAAMVPGFQCLSLPAYAPDASSTQFVRDSGLEGKMLTAFNYGEYAIWHGAPRIRVSMDGRRETVYTQAFIDSHGLFFAGKDTTLPERIGAELAWVPLASPAARALQRAGWVVLHEGERSAVLSRGRSQQLRTHSAGSGTTGCFPGP